MKNSNEHLPLAYHTQAELISGLSRREVEMRTFSQRGFTWLNLPEVLRVQQLDREIRAIREELESRTIPATV